MCLSLCSVLCTVYVVSRFVWFSGKWCFPLWYCCYFIVNGVRVEYLQISCDAIVKTVLWIQYIIRMFKGNASTFNSLRMRFNTNIFLFLLSFTLCLRVFSSFFVFIVFIHFLLFVLIFRRDLYFIYWLNDRC